MPSKISNENQYKFLGLYKWENPDVPRPYCIQLSDYISVEMTKSLFSVQRTHSLPSNLPAWRLIL